MEDILLWMGENAMWVWFGVGLILLSGEMILPGIYLLWIGVAALVTGVVTWLMPGMEFTGQGMVFSVLGVLSIYLANRYFYQNRKEHEGDETVNIRGRQHVGRQYEVIEAIHNGRGKVKVGDSQWLAEGDDANVGDWVEVIDVDGSVMKVAQKS